VTKPNHAPAPEGTDGSRKGRPKGEQRPAWVLSYQRAQRALRGADRLIDSALRTYFANERYAVRRPVRTSGIMHGASGWLATASRYVVRATRELAKTNACLGREPELARGVPELITEATEQCLLMTQCLDSVATGIFSLHAILLAELKSGDLVPERLVGIPRIHLAPRFVFVRAFLSARQPRVADRIAAILSRRRRTPRPAAVRVPRRNPTGRAPPLSSICLL